MINLINKSDCCGCTSCYNSCPTKAISMSEDSEGFIYPSFDETKCIDCSLCEKVCPHLNDECDSSFQRKSVVARDVRENVLLAGTSGSLYTCMMESIISQGGAVYGVIVDDSNIVKHVKVSSLDDDNFHKIPYSKYVRSDISGIFSSVKNDLSSNRLVLFSGTPCQVAGLKKFLIKDYDNLITIDVVCRGNPSPLVWKKYVEFQEKKNKSKISNVIFRNKTYGYHSGTMKLTFRSGKIYYGSARVNIFLKLFFNDYISRPSCYNCKFKKTNHVSDLTLFDCWHFEELCNKKDDNMGYTNIIIQSQKGDTFLSSLKKHLQVFETCLDKAIKYDGIMIFNSVNMPNDRSSFFIDINKGNDFERTAKKYINITYKDKIIEKLKPFYYFNKGFKARK